MKATNKSQIIENLLTDLTGVSRVGAVAEGSCVTCSGEATEFRDALSQKEYTISAMCQTCQDEVWE